MQGSQLVAFGCGYVATALALRLQAEGWGTFGTVRSEARAQEIARSGVTPLIWASQEAMPPDLALDGAVWLISAPPDAEGCPVFRTFRARASRASAIAYLSTTGVYGDLGGGWAFEETPRQPQSREAENRRRAEDQWLSAGAQLFRLPGIYGPGRSALERVLEPGARRIIKRGQVFSRAHRDDIAAALRLAFKRPRPGAIYNICDDEPAPADIVLVYAAALLGVPPPPAVPIAEAGLSEMAQRFYAECKRVSNAKAKAALGWRPVFPTYREGLRACFEAGRMGSSTELG